MNQAWILSLVVAASVLSASAAAQTVESFYRDISRFDRDRDGAVSREDLVRYTLRDVARPSASDSAKAETYADSLFVPTLCRPGPCQHIPVADAAVAAVELLAQRDRVRRTKRDLLPGFQFGRDVSDAANPRGGKLSAPLVGSVTIDVEAGKVFPTVLGSASLPPLAWDPRPGLAIAIRPGVEVDIATKDSTEETSLTFAVPLQLNHTWFDGRVVRDVALSLTPKYITDQAFRRDVYEVGVDATFSSPLIGAGYVLPRPATGILEQPPIGVQYRIHGFAEVGRVEDAGGNASLEAIEADGTYVRVGPRVKVSVYPYAVSRGLRLWGDYTHRFSLTQRNNWPYLEAGISHDLALDGKIQLTGIYRTGERAPAFTRVHSFVVGIGVQIK